MKPRWNLHRPPTRRVLKLRAEDVRPGMIFVGSGYPFYEQEIAQVKSLPHPQDSHRVSIVFTDFCSSTFVKDYPIYVLKAMYAF